MQTKGQGQSGRKRISVAMAVYNGEAYLKEQLDSILQQLQKNDELVISDDGSTDCTLDIVRAYAATDKRIQILEGPGRGIKQNIANAIAHTSGAYIFLADQDDVWKPEKVARVLQEFQEKKCHVVVHDCIVTNENLQQVIYPSFLITADMERVCGTISGKINILAAVWLFAGSLCRISFRYQTISRCMISGLAQSTTGTREDAAF